MQDRAKNIERRWKKGKDDRLRLAELLCLNPDSICARAKVDSFLNALLELVRSRKRTLLVGFGSFEWKHDPHKRIPTGEMVETWRLAFKPGRYVKERKWK